MSHVFSEKHIRKNLKINEIKVEGFQFGWFEPPGWKDLLLLVSMEVQPAGHGR